VPPAPPDRHRPKRRRRPTRAPSTTDRTSPGPRPAAPRKGPPSPQRTGRATRPQPIPRKPRATAPGGTFEPFRRPRGLEREKDKAQKKTRDAERRLPDNRYAPRIPVKARGYSGAEKQTIRGMLKQAVKRGGYTSVAELYADSSPNQRRNLRQVGRLVRFGPYAHIDPTARQEYTRTATEYRSPERRASKLDIGKRVAQAGLLTTVNLPDTVRTLGETAFNLGRATVEDPRAVAGSSKQTAIESITGIPQGIKDIAEDPVQAIDKIVQDYEDRYGSVSKDPKAFRERVKTEWGLTPYVFDVAAAAGGGGQVLGAAARTSRFARAAAALERAPEPLARSVGRAGSAAHRAVATERPDLRFSGAAEGGARPQTRSRNLFTAVGQQALDRRRAGALEQRLQRPQVRALDTAVRQGEVTPVTNGIIGRSLRETPFLRRYTGRTARDIGGAQSTQRIRLLTHSGRTSQKMRSLLRGLDDVQKVVLPEMARLGVRADADGIAALELRLSQIPADSPDAAAIRAVLADPDKYLTAKAGAVVDELRDIQVPEAQQDPRLPKATEEIRRLGEQARLLGVERGPNVDAFRATLAKISEKTGVDVTRYADDLARAMPEDRPALAKKLVKQVRKEVKRAEADVETAKRRLAVARERYGIRDATDAGGEKRNSAGPSAGRVKSEDEFYAVQGDIASTLDSLEPMLFSSLSEWSDGVIKGQANRLRDEAEIKAAFAPLRERLRERFGDTVVMFRGTENFTDDGRRHTSWTLNRRLAENFGGDVEAREIPVDNIVAALGPSRKFGAADAYNEFIVERPPTVTEARRELATLERERSNLKGELRGRKGEGYTVRGVRDGRTFRIEGLRDAISKLDVQIAAARSRVREVEAAAPRTTPAQAARVERRQLELAARRETRDHVRKAEKALKAIHRKTKSQARKFDPRLLEDHETFVARVRAAADEAGLAEPAYWKGIIEGELDEAPRLKAVGKGLRATERPKRTEYRLSERGEGERSPDVLIRGAETNIKRRFQYQLVIRNIETHAFDWSRGEGNTGMTIDQIRWYLRENGIDPESVEMLDTRILSRRDVDLDEDPVAEGLDQISDHRMSGKQLGRAIKAGDYKDMAQNRYLVFPREVGEAVDGAAVKLDRPGMRMWEVAVKTKPTRLLLLAFNVPWLAFQTASNAVLTGLGGGINPFDIYGSYKYFKGLDPEAMAAIEAEFGVTHGHAFHMDQPNVGATNSRTVATWRGIKATKAMRVGHRMNPLDAIFGRSDEAQNNFYRRTLFYSKARKLAYRRMGYNWRASARNIDVLMDRVLARPPERMAQNIARHGREFEAAAKHVNDFLGDYLRFSPSERLFLSRHVMFYGYLRFSLRFTFYTMPVGHPIMTDILGNIGRLGAWEIHDLFGVPRSYGLPTSMLAQVYFGNRQDAVNGTLRSVNFGRMNPFLNAITQMEDANQAYGLVSPMYQMLADQAAEESSFTGRDWRVRGEYTPSESDRPKTYYGDKDRARIALRQGLKLAFPYRVAEDMLLKPSQTDDALAWSPRPLYPKEEEAKRGVAQSRQAWREEGPARRLGASLIPVLPTITAAPQVIKREREKEADMRNRGKGRRKRRRRSRAGSFGGGGGSGQFGGSSGSQFGG
jgi:hypothetical protein